MSESEPKKRIKKSTDAPKKRTVKKELTEDTTQVDDEKQEKQEKQEKVVKKKSLPEHIQKMPLSKMLPEPKQFVLCKSVDKTDSVIKQLWSNIARR